MKKLLIIPLSALLLAACVDTFDVKPDSKLQSQLPPDAKVTDEGHLLASGRVVSISDGDTLTVLGANNQRYKIRLQGIDAPEKTNPTARNARKP